MIKNLTYFASSFVLFLSFILQPAFAQAKVDIRSVLDRLDESLSHKQEYEQKKIEVLRNLRNLAATTIDDEIRYLTEAKIYHEYSNYRYDSAAYYAQRCLATAEKMRSPQNIAEAKCFIAFTQVAAGISLEAVNTLRTVNTKDLSHNALCDYYSTYFKLWLNETNRVTNTEFQAIYYKRANQYLDSLCSIVKPSAPEYWDFIGSRFARDKRHAEAIETFKKCLDNTELSDHYKAMVHAEIAWEYNSLGDEDSAIYHFAESAIHDNESSTREITARYLLAQRIDKRCEHDRAIRYIHLSLDDINFYNASQRKLEIGNILPEMEKKRYNIIAKQKNIFLIGATLALLIAFVVTLTLTKFRRKNRQLAEAEARLTTALAEQEQLNRQLTEANKIKTEYIGQSFYANAEFITKFEKLFKSVERHIATHQINKIHDLVSPDKLEVERNNMYASFDATFLGLFPNFIQQYNSLFDEKDIRPTRTNDDGKPEPILTSEMRIFALIRMGITDSERIGKFLDYSVHTVNTYKTRVKNRSIVKNEEFESRIFEI